MSVRQPEELYDYLSSFLMLSAKVAQVSRDKNDKKKKNATTIYEQYEKVKRLRITTWKSYDDVFSISSIFLTGA